MQLRCLRPAARQVRMRRFFQIGLAVCWTGIALPVPAAVRINEFVALASSRVQQRQSNGLYRVGAGPMWKDADFDASGWPVGPGPFGYGAKYATDVQPIMQSAAVSLYLRDTFVTTAAAIGSNRLSCAVDYDSGFVAYLNGREFLRKNLGAAGSFVYRDQPAFNTRTVGTTNYFDVGLAAGLLVDGTNVLAIQLHNDALSNSTFGIVATLSLAGAATNAVARPGDLWRYFKGSQEPSGGLVDTYALQLAGSAGREWTLPTFNDLDWPAGPGGFGFGYAGLGTDVGAAMQNQTVTLYLRKAFYVSAAVAASTNPVSLGINYDDGYCAYVNGTEVGRGNLGVSNTVIYCTSAATAARAATAVVTNKLRAANLLLVSGTNVLAVEVHNVAAADADLALWADLWTTNGALVGNAETWKYFVGLDSPIPQGDEEDAVDLAEVPFEDWIELYNDDAAAVPLADWSLSDDPDTPGRWRFPAGASVPAGGYLVVLCTGRDVRNLAAPYLQTSFTLKDGGEHLGLYDPAGTLVSGFVPKYPKQDGFHSYGWDAASGGYRYFSSPTPGAANAGPTFALIADKPNFVLPGGFYSNSISCTITTTTAGAAIRYTFDGSEPRLDNGFAYAGGFAVSSALTVRARSFLSNAVPSATATRTYLVNLTNALYTLPAVSLAGDWTNTWWRSNGVLAIIGGVWTGGLWIANSPDDFNIPILKGRVFERPACFEFITTNGGPVYRTDAGIRCAGSAYSRPRYLMQSMAGAWPASATDKPQLNLFFRSDYGDEPIDFPFVAGSRVTQFEGIRLRSGKNDIATPFIRDEVCRRLLADTGQPTSRGVMASLFVNGIFRNYYNPVERYDERFFQEWYGGHNHWDILNLYSGASSGDSLFWNDVRIKSTNLNCALLADYQTMSALVDPENFCDYIAVNAYAAMWDWPANNYYMARERVPGAKLHFHMWDAEGSFGLQTGYTVSRDTFTTDLLNNANSAAAPAIMFKSFYKSPEFRLLFADRMNRHLFNGGALTATNITAHAWELKRQIDPVMTYVRNSVVDIGIWTNWVTARPTNLLTQMRALNLWPATGPPLFGQPGGPVTNGFAVTLVNTNGAGDIYYALDGADPRATGGGIAGLLYTAPIPLDRSRYFRARVLNGAEWSPVAESTYLSDLPPIVISEIMYHPDGSAATEFVELLNAGTNDISLLTLSFTKGITFTFASSPVATLAPGQRVLVVQDLAAFAARYATNGLLIAGVYSGSLNNAGETLELSDAHFGVLQSFDYQDGWYPQTDGQGFSLVVRDPNAYRDAWGNKTNWTASSYWGGSPGVDEPGAPLPAGTVVVNEALTHADASPVGDWIELHNTTGAGIDLGGWFLSDNADLPMKYRIPDGTWLPADGYAVFDSTNHFAKPTNASPFGLSEYGEQIVLSSPLDAQGHPTGYREQRDFGAGEREVTFGRYVRSDGREAFVAQRAATPGAANAGPLVGPLVISEILYAPSTDAYEYVQLYNFGPGPVSLYDPANPTNVWHFDGAVRYAFPPGVVVAPCQSLIVAGTGEVAFRERYGLADDCQVYGPWEGRLDNAGESVKLYKPLDIDITPTETNTPFALVEEVGYGAAAPWPARATNVPIRRVWLAAFADDPANWRAGTAGAAPVPLVAADSDGDGLPDAWEGAHGYDPGDPSDGLRDDGNGVNRGLSAFVFGTNPTNAADVFALGGGATNGLLSVTFRARRATGAGYTTYARHYALESLTNLLATNWTPLAGSTNILGNDSNVRKTFSVSSNAVQFIRGRVWLERTP